jgi:hypothetical protein
MIKLILDLLLFKYKMSERSLQKSLRISCQSVLIHRKISVTFYAKSREKYVEFEENNKELIGRKNYEKL